MSDNYVIQGEWKDDEWHDLAATYKNNVNRTNENAAVVNAQYYAGPRLHPYGVHAFTIVVDGKPRVYPTREAAIADGVETDTSVST